MIKTATMAVVAAFVALPCLAAGDPETSPRPAEPVAKVGARVLDQSEIEEAFGPDPETRDGLRSLAVVSLVVVQAIGGQGEVDGAPKVSLKEAALFMEGMERNARTRVEADLSDRDVREAYELRRRGPNGGRDGDLPWERESQEDKVAFRASVEARIAFRMACSAIRNALETTSVTWLVPQPESWQSTFKSPTGCGPGTP